MSSATLRNVLARLEEQGYVRQPHTSAGRVPTDLGYRSYVDQVSVGAPRSHDPRRPSRRGCGARGASGTILSHVSQEVSRASHQVGFAIAPAADTTTLEHLNFVPLDGGKILVVVVGGRRTGLAQGHRARPGSTARPSSSRRRTT